MSVFVLSAMAAALGAAPAGYDPHVAQRLIAYADAAYCGDKAHGGTDTGHGNATTCSCATLSAA